MDSSLYADSSHYGKRPTIPRWVWVGAACLVVALLLLRLLGGCGRTKGVEAEPSATTAEASATEDVADSAPPPRVYNPENLPTSFSTLNFPTTVDITAAPFEAFMPSNPANPGTAFFGSERTGTDGRARWHNGVDIAPVRKDRNGRALDTVSTMVDGTVVYVERVGGNSQYGIHAILEHDDPIGKVYTLYAHLASLAPEIKVGAVLTAKTPVGIIGNTGTQGIALSRSHVHVEFNLMLNYRFGAWYKEKQLTPDRGRYHGYNLVGANPISVFSFLQNRPGATFLDFVQSIPVGFEILINNPKKTPIDYFERYPKLWDGPKGYVGAVAVKVADSGIILAGRPATDDEKARLSRNSNAPVILSVNETVLGRNGYRIIAKGTTDWVLGKNDVSRRWFELLTY